MLLLSVDGGSSSLKFALYRAEGSVRCVRVLNGQLPAVEEADAALAGLLAELGPHLSEPLGGIGHRIVFGGREYVEPTLADERVLDHLEQLVAVEPLHLRAELDLVYALAKRFPGLGQVLCFDTAFHRHLPALAKRLPLAQDLDPMLERYGFHGLSYEYVVSHLAGPPGRTVIAHLGSGASLCALIDGTPIETTMGFSALGGLMMGTRPGDLDPGVILRLLTAGGYDAARLSDLLYYRCGLLGVSGTSADMKTLLAAYDRDDRAREAVELFVHTLIKHLGASIAVLGGLDTLVFTGGIGERAAPIRAAACGALAFVGLALDADANARSAAIVSAPESQVVVRVVPTDENSVIARAVLRRLFPASSKTSDTIAP